MGFPDGEGRIWDKGRDGGTGKKEMDRSSHWLDTIRKWKLQLFGHVRRMPEYRLLKILILGMVEGSRQPEDATKMY